MARVFDLRPGEAKITAQAFCTLALIIAAHTILETARDALFLTKLPPDRLTIVYVILAGLTLVAAGLAARFSRTFGRRNALVCTLVLVAFGTTLLRTQSTTSRGVLTLYVFSGLAGTVLATQFWMLAGQMFTVTQGRRLFGPIAAGGVLGAVVGASLAAALLSVMPVKTLLIIAAGLLVATALLLTTVRVEEVPGQTAHAIAARAGVQALKQSPFLLRIAALIALATCAALAADYLFKSSSARAIPREELGHFFARYYALLNTVALVLQLFAVGRVMRRLGVTGAIIIVPLLMMAGAMGVIASGGVLLAVLLTKGVDGSLRHSLHRVSTELLFLPLPPEVRDRGKALLDAVLQRLVQAAMAGVIFSLAALNLATPTVLGSIVLGSAALWLVVAGSMRRPYLNLFRQALAAGMIQQDFAQELELNSVEALMEALSSREPARVLSALNILHHQQRSGLIPGLILYHDDETVLVRALEIFCADKKRADWPALAERLVRHGSEAVRIAAVRALAQRGIFDVVRVAAADASPTVRAYASFHLVHEDTVEPLEHAEIRKVLEAPGLEGRALRRALVAAIHDSADERWTNVLLTIADQSGDAADPEAVEQGARAMARIRNPRFIPALIRRLGVRDGRDSVREALVAFGDEALDALKEAWRDPSTKPRARLHIPRTISRFGTQRACDLLTEILANEKDGFVRYKALRGLGRLVMEREVKVDRARIGSETRRNLREHLRLLAHRVALDTKEPSPTRRLLLGLLDDKARQALERAFRLLQIAHREENIQRAYLALGSDDRRARANASEFIDTLTMTDPPTRELARIAIEDTDMRSRVERAAELLPELPSNEAEAMRIMLKDRDAAVAAIAAELVLELPVTTESDRERPSLQALSQRFFGPISLRNEPSGA